MTKHERTPTCQDPGQGLGENQNGGDEVRRRLAGVEPKNAAVDLYFGTSAWGNVENLWDL